MRAYTRAEIEQHRPGGIVEVTGEEALVYGPVGSGTMWVNTKDKSIAPHLMREPFWEAWITSWHTRHLHEYDTYVDVGANSGYYSLLARFYGLKVIAVEANPMYVKLLKKTFGNEIKIVPAAIADKSGHVEFHLNDELHGGSSIFTEGQGESIRVKSVALGTLGAVQKPLVKMDIEGAEELAFQGGEKWLAENKADIILEYTPSKYSDKFYDTLARYGDIKLVDYEGNEQDITKEQANGSEDWITLIVRHDG